MKPTWSTACPDWESRVVGGRSLVPFAPLFPAEADEALAVFGALKMVDATGGPLMSETVLPWVNDFVAAIFGAYNPDSARRLISEFMLLISKKNGKSTIAAGIMLTALILNWRHSGEFIILAPTKEVADNSYKPIRDMIAADDELKAIFHVQDHIRTVTHRQLKATLKVVAADSDTVSGKKAIGVFVDELHEFGKQVRAANMLLEATGGLASRPEGFVIYATTQSDEPPAGVFKTKLQYARQVRDGKVIDPGFLPVLYEFPPSMLAEEAHLRFENAYVTNPNWGVSVDEEFIRRRFMQAKEDGPQDLAKFLAKHLNVEPGSVAGAHGWAGAEFWTPQAEAGLTLKSLLARCEVVTVGIDGGGLDDLLGLAVLGRERGTDRWLHWGKAWLHPIAMFRRKSEASRYEDFKADGDLEIIATLPDDVSAVADLVLEIKATGLLAGIGMDPERTHKVMKTALENAGIEEDLMLGIPQGWKLTGAMGVAERKLAERTLHHGGSRMMAWCVSNAKVEPRGNAQLITKQASGWAKIDPLMALLNAVSLMALNPEPQTVEVSARWL